MPIEKLRPTYTFTQDRLDALQQLVPEAFVDGQINWDTLKEVLGEHLEDEGEEAEHFGLFWPGKRQARRLASIPSEGTLVPAPGEGVDEDTTRHIFIEGDNREVLKLLQKSYAGRVKMIYIDPPYNTGNDFVYSDSFSHSLDEYLRLTNQAGEDGIVLTTNPKSSGRFHSNWLNMIYSRLVLARDLLADDGVLWISIDDIESPHLHSMCREIFGEENFVATFIWEKRTTRENRRVFSFNHDYVLCYAQDKDRFQASRNLLPLTEAALSRYSNPDHDPRGDWQSVSLNAQAGHATPTQFYEITTPGGRRLLPPPGRCWSVTADKYGQLVDDNRVWFGVDGNNVPRRKVFLSETDQGLTPHTLWKAGEVGTTDSAMRDLIALFEGEAVFDTPKPVELIKRMLHISTGSHDIVVDFFAGSCSTAHSVLELNRHDGGNRQFIMVQLPELTPNTSAAYQAGYRTVADIGKERIRRVIAKMQEEHAGQLDLNGRESPEDLGFKVFKLAPSNFKHWQDYQGEDIQELQMRLDEAETPLVDSWKPPDLLTQILLIEGFPLDSRVAVQEGFAHNQVQLVTSDFHQHRLFVCLDPSIAAATIAQLDLQDQDIIVCLDAALSDEAKLRLSDSGNLHVI